MLGLSNARGGQDYAMADTMGSELDHLTATDPSNEPDFSLTIPAARENVALLRHVLGALRDVYRISTTKMDDIVLALSEAATNAAVHAYAEAPGPITVSAMVAGDHMTMVVSDRGRGMTPRVHSTGLGVGLALIACVTESLELRDRSGGGTDLAMVFDLTSHPSPPEAAAAAA
jgi:anti-sigma regulatory factor (Ser/Thr protein kinase)